MVILESSLSNKEYYNWFSYELSEFQKMAIDGIINGSHSLTCVPTGSGKTLVALFAIDYFTRMGKKVIYTSPIKALSNQKYYEFQKTFPHLSIGILTGDIKINPDGDIMIMTAEILKNKLLKENVDESISCIIHDEVHMINDPFRGYVWEQLLMFSPPSVQLVLLSATLDSPLDFAKWIEKCTHRNVYLSLSEERNVPLVHYGYLIHNSSFYKKQKNEVKEMMEDVSNQFTLLKEGKKPFQEINYKKIKNTLNIFHKEQYRPKQLFILESCLKKMKEKEMFPAVCFLLSKRQIELISKDVSVELLEFDSKIPYTIEKEVHSILRHKFLNYREYLELPELRALIKLLEKGIAIHHSGMIPILRELVELLFEKGYIKLLFATETFSVGLNMPIRTTIFTNIFKFDGSQKRMFYPHEFIQASGRAGRRGKDKVGYVIHLCNLYESHDIPSFRGLLEGNSQKLQSKFKFSYHLFFSMEDTREFFKKSFLEEEVNEKVSKLNFERMELKRGIDTLGIIHTPYEKIEEYKKLNSYKSLKQRKKNIMIQKSLIDEYPCIETDIKNLELKEKKEMELSTILKKETEEKEYSEKTYKNIQFILKKEGFLEENGHFTILGSIAKYIHHVPCCPLSIYLDKLRSLEFKELVSILSIFIPISVEEEKKNRIDREEEVEELYDRFYQYEIDYEYYTEEEYILQYDMREFIEKWIEINTIEDSLCFLQEIEREKGISTGNFIKYILQFNNFCNELENVAEYLGDMNFLLQLKKIPEKTQKFIITNQSLYI